MANDSLADKLECPLRYCHIRCHFTLHTIAVLTCSKEKTYFFHLIIATDDQIDIGLEKTVITDFVAVKVVR